MNFGLQNQINYAKLPSKNYPNMSHIVVVSRNKTLLTTHISRACTVLLICFYQTIIC